MSPAPLSVSLSRPLLLVQCLCLCLCLCLAYQASAFTPFPSPSSSRTYTTPLQRTQIASQKSGGRTHVPPLAATSFMEALVMPMQSKRFPGVEGSFKPGLKKVVVITGASSGLGRATAKALANRGDYYIVCGVRDVEKMKKVATEIGLDEKNHAIMQLDLTSFDNVRKFAKNLKAAIGNKPIDSLICNAAVYLPARSIPDYTIDGVEESLQVNHLSHFLLVSLLMNNMRAAKDPRVTIVGSITGNDNTIAGLFVFPQASLGNLDGMRNGSKKPIAMIDGKTFNGAKAYKDSKVCNMMTVTELHERYHEATGITFNTMYPGCIAETPLFREKRQWFRKLFPLFMKYVTGGYVGEDEAGVRLAQTIYEPVCRDSGNYWCWNGNAQQFGVLDLKSGQVVGAGGSGGSIFKGSLSNECRNKEKAKNMWDCSCEITGAVWPKI